MFPVQNSVANTENMQLIFPTVVILQKFSCWMIHSARVDYWWFPVFLYPLQVQLKLRSLRYCVDK